MNKKKRGIIINYQNGISMNKTCDKIYFFLNSVESPSRDQSPLRDQSHHIIQTTPKVCDIDIFNY